MTSTIPAIVQERYWITPSMIRIVLAGEGLAVFESTGSPDESVWICFPHGGDEERGRHYTVRHWDGIRRIMTIDFVCHEYGLATEWAQTARIGDEIRFYPPDARFRPPPSADTILLFSDFSGLPAICRIFEDVTSARKLVAHVEVPSIEDRQAIVISPDRSVIWYETFDRPDCKTRLLEIVRSVTLPHGTDHIWIAGEAKVVAKSRKYFRDVLGVDKSRITAVGYWIEGQDRG